MIAFKTNIEEFLPYSRRHYIDFLDDSEIISRWYGVSFQSIQALNSVKGFIKIYKPLFDDVISKPNFSSNWIINHDDKDLKWFPNDEDNLSMLRALFKNRTISNSFVGALAFTKNDLLNYYQDILSYPFAVFNEEGALYKNLDISNREFEFIIKISAHMTLDFISTDKFILREIIAENTGKFLVKEYRGKSIWI